MAVRTVARVVLTNSQATEGGIRRALHRMQGVQALAIALNLRECSAEVSFVLDHLDDVLDDVRAQRLDREDIRPALDTLIEKLR
jgi:hypothetical protein